MKAAGFFISLLAVAGWLMPLRYFPWRSFHAELLFFWVVCLASAAVAWSARKATHLSLPWLPLLVLPLALATLAADLASGRLYFLGDALAIAGYLCVASTAWVLGHWASGGPIAQTDAVQAWVASVLALAGVLCAGICVAQVLNPALSSFYITAPSSPFDLQRRGVGNFGQTNHAGTFLVWALAAVMYLQGRGRLGQAVFLVATTLIAAALASTQSRTAILSLAVVAAVCAGVGLVNRQKSLAIGWVVALGLTLCFLGLHQEFSAGFAQASAKDLADVSTRTPALKQLGYAAVEHWALGWGWLGTARAQDAFVLEYPSPENLTYAHNVLLDIALWFGLPAAAIVLAYLVLVMLRFARSGQVNQNLFALCLLLPFGIHCMLEYPFAYAYLLVPAAAAWGWVSRVGGAKELKLSPAWMGAWALVGLLVSGTYGWYYVQAESEIMERRFSSAGIGPGYVPPPIKPIWALDQLNAYARSLQARPARGAGAAELLEARALRMRFPHYSTMLRYAVFLSLAGQHQNARNQLLAMERLMAGAWPDARAQLCEASTSNYPELRETLAVAPAVNCSDLVAPKR